MNSRKILYGVCGIGRGHTFRQLPTIRALVKQGHRLVIFAYGESYAFYSRLLSRDENVDVEPVAVPFYVGAESGLDFAATAARNAAFIREGGQQLNWAAMATAQRLIGKPDIVITDYEPVCAQYAYACDAPLVTIDQQSKYLVGDFPAVINGCSVADEIARLRMFFPKATARIASSFFDVPLRAGLTENVKIVASILRDSVRTLPRKDVGNHVLLYISSQREFHQSLDEIEGILGSRADVRFNVFIPESVVVNREPPTNVHFFRHGDPAFLAFLTNCAGIIATAGHSLLSEAMFLGIPVYAIALPVYEQQMNAQVVHRNGFGVADATLNSGRLDEFLGNLSLFRDAIASDRSVLVRGDGAAAVDSFISGALNIASGA